MAQSDIIQKDLGLVTAYGYALAGGYQGTEEQFKIDFANLMAGRYSGSQLHEYSTRYSSDVTLDTEPFTPYDSDIELIYSDLYTYGNISYLALSAKFNTDITLARWSFKMLGTWNKPSNADEKELFKKYMPMDLTARYNTSSFSNTGAAFVGFADHAYNEEDEIRYLKPSYWFDLGHQFLGVSVQNTTDKSIVLSASNSLLIVCEFMNHIGQEL